MDKQELRQDPIREKIIGSLSYLENNRNALFCTCYYSFNYRSKWIL